MKFLPFPIQHSWYLSQISLLPMLLHILILQQRDRLLWFSSGYGTQQCSMLFISGKPCYVPTIGIGRVLVILYLKSIGIGSVGENWYQCITINWVSILTLSSNLLSKFLLRTFIDKQLLCKSFLFSNLDAQKRNGKKLAYVR